MKEKSIIWILVIIAGFVLEFLAVMSIVNEIKSPELKEVKEYPLLPAGVLLAGGIVLIVSGFRLRKREDGENEK